MKEVTTPEMRRQRQAHYATILGALVTAGSMLFGVLTYQRSAAHQRQAASLGILQDYLKMAVEHPDLASRDPGQAVDAEYEWFATHALFTAETLSVLGRSEGSRVKWGEESVVASLLLRNFDSGSEKLYTRTLTPSIRNAPGWL